MSISIYVPLARHAGHCQLTTAISKNSPLGPFDENRTVLRSSAVDGPYKGSISHNVQPVLGPDGAVYIFMITSNPHPGISSKNASVHPNLTVAVGRADRFGAAFEWVTPMLLQKNNTPILKDNPTAIVFGNGSVLMATRGTALFKADTWRGPYRMLSASIIPHENLPNKNPESTKTEGR